MKAGIIGLPNVGKSTLFNILLDKTAAASSNFPFTTIEPNTGVVPVPDERLERLADVIESQKGKRPPIVYSRVTIVDIAGLVRGAHKGEGLGNMFLSHIREVDVVVHVVRVFDDPNIVRVGENPKEDIDTIRFELVLKDIESLERQLGKLQKKHDKEAVEKKDLIKKLIVMLSNEGRVVWENLSEKERGMIKDMFLLSVKPVIFVFNLTEEQLKDKKLKADLKQMVAPEPVVWASLKTEQQLMGLSGREKREYLKLLGEEKSAVDKLIEMVYKRLGLISFFTAGEKEVRAWSIKQGTPAVKGAGVIHSDFEKYFVKAKVVGFDDFVAYQGFEGARQAGKLRLEGKEYVIEDGDVVEFMIGG